MDRHRLILPESAYIECRLRDTTIILPMLELSMQEGSIIILLS